MAQDMKSWVQGLHGPVVMVASSPAADGLCTTRNGLSIVDILRPYSHLTQLKGLNACVQV